MLTLVLLAAFLSLSAGEGLKNVIDLTYPFDNDTLYWTGVQRFEFTKKVANVRENGVFYAMNEFCAGEHGGTHLDAPYHFNKNGRTVGDIGVDNLIVPGVVVDLRGDVEKDGSKVQLLPKHLDRWVETNGPLPNNSVVLVRFGWSQYWPDKKKYFGVNETDNTALNFPGISKEAAQWIVDCKKIVGVGVDTASIDSGTSMTFDAHVVLNTNEIYLLENVFIDEKLPARGFTLFIMPMKIQDGTGAPLRIVATPTVNFMKYN